MYEIDVENGEKKPLDNLQAYLYDIGPEPSVVFELEVEQLLAPSKEARRANIVVERYMLLKPNQHTVYDGLDSLHTNANDSLQWVYHGPVNLSFSRQTEVHSSDVTFTSSPHQFTFLDPENPITFAKPLNYTIQGFAFRFALVPSSFLLQDENWSNNAYQLTFLKP